MDLSGVVDLHIHCSPDVPTRKLTTLEAAKQARDAGMAAVFVKSHISSTAGIAGVVGHVVPGIGVYGGLALDYPVGGLNPMAVEAAIGMGARMVFMPTLDSLSDFQAAIREGTKPEGSLQTHGEGRQAAPGLTIFESDGGVLPEVRAIVRQIAAADVALATGHISSAESAAMVELALASGVRRVVVTHALYRNARMPLEMQKKLAARGAYIEHCWVHMYPSPGKVAVKLEEIVECIRAVGPERTILSTDTGQIRNPLPVDAMADFLDQMSGSFSKSDLLLMASKNPAFILKHEA